MKTKEELDELGRDPAAVNLWLETVSPSARIELEAPCLLPGHSGVGCVSLDRRTQIYKYRCDCAKRVWWWLPELYAARHDGRIEGLGKGERCSWTRRLFLEAGVPMALPPEESIGIPPAPADATDAARRLRDGFVLLVRLKAIGFADQSVLYSRRFAARWNALTLEEAQQGIAALRVAGVLRRLNERGLPYFHSGLPRGWRP